MIPKFKRPEFISDAIESVQAQALGKIVEVIVVCNGDFYGTLKQLRLIDFFIIDFCMCFFDIIPKLVKEKVK